MAEKNININSDEAEREESEVEGHIMRSSPEVDMPKRFGRADADADDEPEVEGHMMRNSPVDKPLGKVDKPC